MGLPSSELAEKIPHHLLTARSSLSVEQGLSLDWRSADTPKSERGIPILYNP